MPRPTLLPCVIEPSLVFREMFDCVYVRLRADRYHTPECGIGRKSGQERPELIPADGLKFFRAKPEAILR